MSMSKIKPIIGRPLQQHQHQHHSTQSDLIVEKLSDYISSIETHLRCPICLDHVTDAHTNPECLHRFCGKCIKRSLNDCKNDCPQCRIHIPTYRTLRKDTQFEQLKDIMLKIIQIIQDGQKEIQQKSFETINNNKLPTIMIDSHHQVRNATPSPTFRATNSVSVTSTMPTTPSFSASSIHGHDDTQLESIDRNSNVVGIRKSGRKRKHNRKYIDNDFLEADQLQEELAEANCNYNQMFVAFVAEQEQCHELKRQVESLSNKVISLETSKADEEKDAKDKIEQVTRENMESKKEIEELKNEIMKMRDGIHEVPSQDLSYQQNPLLQYFWGGYILPPSSSSTTTTTTTAIISTISSSNNSEQEDEGSESSSNDTSDDDDDEWDYEADVDISNESQSYASEDTIEEDSDSDSDMKIEAYEAKKQEKMEDNECKLLQHDNTTSLIQLCYMNNVPFNLIRLFPFDDLLWTPLITEYKPSQQKYFEKWLEWFEALCAFREFFCMTSCKVPNVEPFRTLHQWCKKQKQEVENNFWNDDFLKERNAREKKRLLDQINFKSFDGDFKIKTGGFRYRTIERDREPNKYSECINDDIKFSEASKKLWHTQYEKLKAFSSKNDGYCDGLRKDEPELFAWCLIQEKEIEKFTYKEPSSCFIIFWRKSEMISSTWKRRKQMLDQVNFHTYKIDRGIPLPIPDSLMNRGFHPKFYYVLPKSKR